MTGTGPPARPRPTALATAGRWLLVAAGLVVAFVAYQQWGTAVGHWRAQSSLRSQFDQAAAAVHAGRARGAAVAVAYPAVGDPVGVLVIPRLGLDQVIVEGVGSAQLAAGPGHYPSTPLPGQAGNAAVAGHRTTHGAPFYGLDTLVVGDPIEVTTLQGRFTYRVARHLVVDPSDSAVLDPSTRDELTLTTCNPKYSAAQRLVVVADLVTPPAPTLVRPPADGTPSGTVDPARSVGTWLLLAGAVLGLVACVVLVSMVRRRPTGRWAGRVVLGVGLVAGAVLVLVAFGALDTLLPPSF